MKSTLRFIKQVSSKIKFAQIILSVCVLSLLATTSLYAQAPGSENYDDNPVGSSYEFGSGVGFTIDQLRYVVTGAGGPYNNYIDNFNGPIGGGSDHYLRFNYDYNGAMSRVEISAANGSSFRLAGFEMDVIADGNVLVTNGSGSQTSYSSNGMATTVNVDLSSNSDFENITSFTIEGGNLILDLDELDIRSPVTSINAPIVTTSAASSITASGATFSGNVTDDGGDTVTERGFVYGINSNPTTSDTKIQDGTGTGAFSEAISGLNPETTYYVRAYAINGEGTSYGSEQSFTTSAVSGEKFDFESATATYTGWDTKTLTVEDNDVNPSFAITATADKVFKGSENGWAYNGSEGLYFGWDALETQVDFEIETGNSFDLKGFYISHQGDGDPNNEYILSTDKGSITITPPIDEVGELTFIDVAGNANAAYFQDIDSFTLQAPTGGEYFEIDDIILDDFQKTIDNNGDVTAAGGVTEPVGLPTTATSSAGAVDVFDFNISDGGGDGFPLNVTALDVNVSGTSTDAERGKVTWRLDGPDASNVIGSYDAGTDKITFSGLSISITESGYETYTINAYYNDNTGLTEDRTFILSVDGDTDLTLVNDGSKTQMGATSAVTNGSGSTIDITATQLAFTTQPAGSVSGSALTTQPVVTAQDAAGNTDVDFTENITLTEASAGTLTNNTQAATNGVATFSALTYTATADQQSFTLTANDQDGVGSNLPTVDANAVTSDVVATKLVFTTQPAPTSFQVDGSSTSFTTVPVVEAVDANDMVDTGYSTGFVLSEVNGTGSATLTGTGDVDGSPSTVTLVPASGAATFTNLAIDYSLNDANTDENFNLQAASGGLTSANSTQLTAIADTAPTGYTVSWDDALINASEASSTTFTVSNAEVGATINYSISSSEDGNTVTVSGSESVTSSTQQVTADVSSLTDGKLTVEVSLTDDGNNTGDNETDNSATLDQTAPAGYSVSIDQNPINAANDEAVSFTFAGAEVGATYNYTFSSSGGGTNVTGSGTITTATDQITGIDLSGLGDGTITLSATLTDSGGNTGTAATDTRIKDTVAPSGYLINIDLLGESFINVINETIIEFSASGLEVGSTLNYAFTSDGGGTPVSGTETVTSATEQFDNSGAGYDLSGLTDGSVTLTISLTDDAGNMGADATDSESKDAGPPTGYSVSWDDALINASEATTATFTVSDAEIGSTINNLVSSSGDGNTATVSNPTKVTSNTQQVTIDVSSLVDGTLTVELSLTDEGGNTGGTLNDNSATIDQTAPAGYSVSIDQDPIGADNTDAVSFTFAGAEVGATYDYTFSSSGGGTNVTGSGTVKTATDQITGIDLSGFGDGTITLSVVLTDEAGNAGSAATDTGTKVIPPEASDSRILTERNVEYIFKPDDFGATNSNYSIKIESLTDEGSLKLSGSNVSAGDEIPVSSIENDLLTWSDTSDEYGYGYTGFDFTVIDDSDVESAESYTLSVDVGIRTVQLTEGKGWRFLSSTSPDDEYVNIFNGVDVDLPPATYPSLYELDQPTYSWEPVQSLSASPEQGEGFIFYGKLGEMPVTLSFDGEWTALSDIYAYDNLDYDGTGESANSENFYLVGNPHPIALDFCEFDLSDVSQTITFWDPQTGAGDYVSRSCDIEKGIEIAPFQSFWIRTTDVHPSASIPEEAYVNSSSEGYFKEKTSGDSEQPLITLNLTSQDNAFSNQLHLLFSDDAKEGLDAMDAPKLSAEGLASEWLSFYSMDSENETYAIQVLPFPAATSQQDKTVLEIPLNVETTEDGFFKMDWALGDLSALDADIYLKDNVTGHTIDLTSQEQYSFMLKPTVDVEKAKDQEALQILHQPFTKLTEIGQHTRFTLLVDYGASDQNSVGIDLPEEFALQQNYPNPFNPVTVIQFQLASQSNVELSVYDLTGRQVAIVVDKPMQAGNHQVSFNAQDLSSGVYIYTLKAGSQMLSRKLTIVK